MSQELVTPGPEIPVIDESRLIAEFGEDAEILAELRDLFLQHVPPLYNSIQEAVFSGDSLKLSQDAHSLKGACATFGAPRLAMVCLDAALQGKGAQLLLQVHDELVVETAVTTAEEVAGIMKETMEQAFVLDVPLKVDVGIGRNWAEIH